MTAATFEPTEFAAALTLAGHEARRAVRTGLDYCPTCRAAAGLSCRTASGKRTRRHVGRAR